MQAFDNVERVEGLNGYVEGASIPRLAKMHDDLETLMTVLDGDHLTDMAKFSRIERAVEALERWIVRFERSEIEGTGPVPYSMFSV